MSAPLRRRRRQREDTNLGNTEDDHQRRLADFLVSGCSVYRRRRKWKDAGQAWASLTMSDGNTPVDCRQADHRSIGTIALFSRFNRLPVFTAYICHPPQHKEGYA
nr:hypothetical protein CFP56_13035 [Quercus suber]